MSKKDRWHILKQYPDRSSIHFFIIVEIVLACLLPALFIIYEDQGRDTQLCGFTEIVFLVVRIFDEAILPMHLVCVSVFRCFILFPF